MESQRRLTIASALLHVAVLAIVLHVGRIEVEPARFPGTEHGSRISLTYSPGGAPAQSAMAAVKPEAAKLTQQVKSVRDTHTHVAAATTTAPPSPNPSAARGMLRWRWRLFSLVRCPVLRGFRMGHAGM